MTDVVPAVVGELLLLHFVDTNGRVWMLNAYTGAIFAASFASPRYLTPDCTGTSYIPGIARWVYSIRGSGKLVVFGDTAQPTKVVPQSWNPNGTCEAINANASPMYSVSDGTEIAAAPTGLFSLPVHPEYVP